MGPDAPTDPADWSIDEVVDFLCGTLTPWSQSTNAPRPDVAVLEAALRDNQVTGGVLLNHVDLQVLRDDLGLKPFGPRSNIMTAIEYLRRRSGKYRFAKSYIASSGEGDSNTPPAHTRSRSRPRNQSRRSPLLRTNSPEQPLDRLERAVVTPPNSPALNTLGADPNSTGSSTPARQPERRRIAPTIVSAPAERAESSGRQSKRRRIAPTLVPSPAEIQPELVGPSAGSTSDQGPEDQPSAFAASPSAGEEADLSEGFPKDLGPYAKLLEMYPAEVSDEGAFPEYGESGSDGEYDEETWQEILDENPQLSQDQTERAPRPQHSQEQTELAPDVFESVVSEFISKQKESWKESQLPKLLPKARNLWQQTRRIVEEAKSNHSDNINRFEKRLDLLKQALREAQYESVSRLQDGCGCLEVTLSSLWEDKWKRSIIEQEECPQAVPRPRGPRPRGPRPQRTRKPKSQPDEEETWNSASEDDMDDFIVDDSHASDGSSESSDRPLVDVSDAVSDRFLVSIPEHRPETGVLQMSTLSASSEDSEPIHKPSKRPRRTTDEKGTGNLAGFFDNSDIECIDMTATTPEPDMDVEMNIKTPPLNPAESVEQPESMEEDTTLHKKHHGSDAEDELEIETPLVNPVQDARAEFISPPPDLGSNVLIGSSEEDDSEDTDSDKMPGNDVAYDKVFDKVAKMDAETIVDRLELLAKIVSLLSPEERAEFPAFLSGRLLSNHKALVQDALFTMIDNKWEIASLDPSDSKLAMRMGTLYVSWVNRVFLNADQGVKRKPLQKALKDVVKETKFPAFFQTLTGLLSAFKNWQPQEKQDQETPREASSMSPEIIVIDSEDLTAKSKKRKRRVLESKETKNTQKRAQNRARAQAKRREAMLQTREKMGLSNDDPNSQAVTFNEPIIYLDPHIGGSVKPHQLNGIQFMWRELIEDENAEGCLLAHTMGLGKTMQVIALLVTISASSASDNPKIRKQIPESFHRSQTLILSPSSLIQNWQNEFYLWMPPVNHLGPLKLIYPRGKLGEMAERLQDIRDWDEGGGVLIMSYDIFRSFVLNKETKSKGKPLDDATHEMVKKALIKRPNIVVADEAHKIKNPSAGISQAASLFRTKCRIAMTGSPLSNSLLEYYNMVDWIAPGYLDDLAVFTKKFVEPIEEATFIDSTAAQRRRGLVQLQLLSRILAPKIHRADVSAIAADIPPKTEFVLLVDLSDLQKKAYNIYVTSVEMGLSKIVNTQLWSWLYVLQLLCNHLSPFREKLVNRATSLGEELPDPDVSYENAQISDALLHRLEELFKSEPDMDDPILSHRVVLLNKILDESAEVGDKVLIFTQSLPTLDYIERMMQRANRNYCRLDGKTPVRQRQSTTQNFNSDGEAQVYLISTRAGGLGLNIFGANRVVIFDFQWNPSWEQQAIGRAYRLGQKKPVFVYRFISGGTFEEKILNKTLWKTQLAVRVVDKRNEMRNATKANTEYLSPLKEVKHGDSSEAMGKDQILDRILTGEFKDMVLKATRIDSRDDENDRLTAEEQQDVEKELKMEQLRRTDPEAYRLKEAERAREKEEAQRALFEESRRHQEQVQRQYPPQQLPNRPVPGYMGTEQIEMRLERPQSRPHYVPYGQPQLEHVSRSPPPHYQGQSQQQVYSLPETVDPTHQHIPQQHQQLSQYPVPTRPQDPGRISTSPPSKASPLGMATQAPSASPGQTPPALINSPISREEIRSISHEQFMQYCAVREERLSSTLATTSQTPALPQEMTIDSATVMPQSPSAPVHLAVDADTGIAQTTTPKTDASEPMEMSEGEDGN